MIEINYLHSKKSNSTEKEIKSIENDNDSSLILSPTINYSNVAVNTKNISINRKFAIVNIEFVEIYTV